MRLFALMFLLIPALTFADQFPNGWRLASNTELSAGNSQQTQINSDFNGDGISDSAFVLKSTEFSGEGLLVKLSGDSGPKWQILEKIHWGPDYPNARLAMSIDLADAGNYLTACGKGQWQCDQYETAEFGTANPGIWYYRLGGHKAMFYWNSEKQKFDKQWMSN